MNTTINDKLLSLNKNQKVSQERTTPNAFNTNEESKTAAGPNEGQDSVNLSTAARILHQTTTAQPEKAGTLPETAAHARALVARILQQFEHSGESVLSAHSAIQGKQLDQLLRPDTA